MRLVIQQSSLLVGCLLVAGSPARAELVFFESGRALSVKSYTVDGRLAGA